MKRIKYIKVILYSMNKTQINEQIGTTSLGIS